MATKYLDYAGLQRLVENIDKKYAPISAIVFKSSVDDIASLPSLATQKAGYMYNVTNGGITTADFVEGAGHLVSDGENIAAVELVTGYTKITTVTVNDDPKALGWYEVDAVNYVDVTSTLEPTDDPQAKGLYEFDGTNYVLTTDNTPQSGKPYFEKVTTYALSQDRIADLTKDYYEQETVMKWDLMGGVFDLEDRYLEFGEEFPKSPVDGRTFLYMGSDKKIYVLVASPAGRPNEEGYFEGVFTPVVSPSTAIKNPKEEGRYEQLTTSKFIPAIPISDPAAEGLFEEDPLNPGTYIPTADTTITPGKDYFAEIFAYVLSSDIAYDNTKTYYDGVFTASTDTTVDANKFYYTEEDHYKKAIIYKYSTADQEWLAQSSSGAGDMIPITRQEIDDLFI